MKAYLRLMAGLCPDRELSVVSFQLSASPASLPYIANEQSVLYRRPPNKHWPLDKAIYLRPFLFLILVFVSCGAALAQDVAVKATPAAKAEVEVTPLKIGDKIPEELWDLPLQVVNHPEGQETITLNDYRGKLIILDFWATWCSSCLKAFPNNNAIQEEYQNEVQILLVNTEITKEPKEISFFLKGYSSKHNIPLLQTSIVKDTTLRKLIPFLLIPHYTWIGKDGTIVASTSSEGIDTENISNILTGKEALLGNKMDRLDFDPREPFLLDRDIIETGNLKSGSAFSKPIGGLGRISFGSINITDPLTRIFMINSSVVQMLQEAFQLGGKFNPNRILLNVKDPLKYTYSDKEGLKIEEWANLNSYCYELYSPARSKKEVLQKMQEDVLGYFELDAAIEDREMECWVLTSKNKEIEAFMQKQLKSNGNGLVQSRSIQRVARHLDYELPIPVVNASSYQGEVILDLPEDLSDIEQLLNILNEAGIYLKKDRRVFPVFIITELNDDLKL